MTERYSNQEQRKFTNILMVDNSTLPWLRRGERFNMSIATFPDHGRSFYFGSAIRSNPVFLELARNLTPEESERSNERIRSEIYAILDGHKVRKGAVIPSKNSGPDVHQIVSGNPYDPSSLRIYYTQGEFMGTPAVYQLAIAKQKDVKKVERVLRESGYSVNSSFYN